MRKNQDISLTLAGVILFRLDYALNKSYTEDGNLDFIYNYPSVYGELGDEFDVEDHVDCSMGIAAVRCILIQIIKKMKTTNKDEELEDVIKAVLIASRHQNPDKTLRKVLRTIDALEATGRHPSREIALLRKYTLAKLSKAV